MDSDGGVSTPLIIFFCFFAVIVFFGVTLSCNRLYNNRHGQYYSYWQCMWFRSCCCGADPIQGPQAMQAPGGTYQYPGQQVAYIPPPVVLSPPAMNPYYAAGQGQAQPYAYPQQPQVYVAQPMVYTQQPGVYVQQTYY